jgi:hypothetical protein
VARRVVVDEGAAEAGAGRQRVAARAAIGPEQAWQATVLSMVPGQLMLGPCGVAAMGVYLLEDGARFGWVVEPEGRPVNGEQVVQRARL